VPVPFRRLTALAPPCQLDIRVSWADDERAHINVQHATEADVIQVINKPNRGDNYLDKGVAILTLADWQSIRHSTYGSEKGAWSEGAERKGFQEDRPRRMQGSLPSPGSKGQRLRLIGDEGERSHANSSLHDDAAEEAGDGRMDQEALSAPVIDSTAVLEEGEVVQGKMRGRERPREEDDEGQAGKIKR
jgi:hypothetical protein